MWMIVSLLCPQNLMLFSYIYNAKCGFHLTKWMSNSCAVLNAITEEDGVKEVKDLDLNHDMLPNLIPSNSR